MELYDLLSVAQTNKYFSNLSGDVFRRQYSSKILSISSTFRQSGHERDLLSVSHTHMCTESSKLSTSILRVFGHLVQRLSIDFSFLKPVDRNEIEQVIQKFCFESLNQIEFYRFDKDVLSGFTNPLNGVQMATIQGKFRSSAADFKLSGLFPNLRQLSLSYIDVFDPNVFDVQFTQLQHFDIEMTRLFAEQLPQDFFRNMKSTVENILKKNPTIKSLVFNDCGSMEFVKIASDYLKNLEEIKVNFVALDPYRGEQIHFPNVKTVNFSWNNYNMSGLMSFDKLENLSLSCLAHECIEFLRQNTNVRKLKIIGESLSNQNILTIGGILPNLVELTISENENIEANSIIQLIQNSQQLEKLAIEYFNTEAYNTLCQQINKDWTVNEKRHGIDFRLF